MKLSDIAEKIPASPIRNLMSYARDAMKKGITIHHLNIGDPDIKTPEPMLAILKNWTINPISYVDSRGDAKLLESLQWYYKKLGFNTLHRSNLQVTLGGSEGLLWTFLSICNAGDEIIAFEPFYTNYESFATSARAVLVPVTTSIKNEFHLPEAAQIEKKISSRTKAIIICNPANPTGTVYTKTELDMIVNIAKKHQLYVISDEVYREFVYDGTSAISLLSYADSYPEGIIIVDSLSKRYSICGARIGVIVSLNTELMGTYLRFAQARLSAGLIDQKMAAALIDVDDQYFKNVIEEYRLRRDLLVSELNKIPNVFCPNPEGAFYVIVKLPVADSANFAQWLLTDFSDNSETVMITPAAGFYKTKGLGKNEVRIAYVLNQDKIKRSVELLAKALQLYNTL